jgi:hypothetical protein
MGGPPAEVNTDLQLGDEPLGGCSEAVFTEKFTDTRHPTNGSHLIHLMKTETFVMDIGIYPGCPCAVIDDHTLAPDENATIFTTQYSDWIDAHSSRRI